jgi:formylglycine-generating enzyme required for sulfatase activity
MDKQLNTNLNKMKKVYSLLLALLCAGAVFGQDKEVAVMKPYVLGGATVSNNDQLIMVGAMEEAFTKIAGYKAFSRTSQKLIEAEMAFQRSGAVAEEQIKAVGAQAGVAYICTFTLSIEKNELVIKANIIDVVTAQITNSKTVVCLDRTNRTDIIEKCESLPYKLLGDTSTSGTSGGSSGSSTTTTRLPAGKNITFTISGVSFEMIFVEGGTFVMGCTSEQSDCGEEEKPAHRVTLSDFYMGKFQVTQKLWQVVMGTNVRQQRDLANTSWPMRGEGDDYPMYYISYNECEEFCSKLNKLLSNQLPEGSKFRIPTEAQWEYAARGGKKSKGYKFSGSDYIGEVAWYDGNSGEKTHEVGMKDKNELGIYDMSGNVWEWCQDWYDRNYYSRSPLSNPKGPGSGSDRILRGGSWYYNTPYCRVSYRDCGAPGGRGNDLGFRLCLVP